MKANLVTRLFRVLSDYPFKRKIILAKSFSEGHQLLERISSNHGPVLHAEVSTVEALAVRQAGFELFRSGYRYFTAGETFWLVQSLMERLAGQPDHYIGPGMLSPGIVSQVHLAVCELRNALIAGANLRPDMFVTMEKGKYIRDLLVAYEEMLAENKAADFAGLLPFVSRMEEDVLFVVPEYLQLDPASERMLHIMADDRVVRIEAEVPFHTAGVSDEERELSAVEAVKSEFFHAVGSAAEVREALRRILAAETPFDRVEMIASDYDLYSGTIHALASSLKIPCTYSKGLPLEFTRMGRAAWNLLTWIEEEYPADLLSGMLREGQIAFRDEREENSTGDWIREMERLGIGWGRDRYLTLDPGRVEEERKDRIRSLKSIFQDWFRGLPDSTEWSPIVLLRWLIRILEHYGVCHGEQDALVLQALKEQLDLLQSSPVSSMSLELTMQYTRRLLRGIRCFVTPMPQPGAIHVTSLSDGGVSGRDVTFILGMDEHRWSTAVRQGPVLLDEERNRICPEGLPLSTDISIRGRKERDSRLGLVRGKLVLSYASYMLADKQTQSPAFELLQCFRKAAGNPEADFSALREHLGQPVGYIDLEIDRRTVRPLDTFDVWKNMLLDSDGRWKEGREAVESAYPPLGAGRTAIDARAAESLSSYDGYIGGVVQEESGEESSMRTISASQLEGYAECPMRYYFQYVLRLRPKEAIEFDRSRWLQADERGSLLHRIFFLYLKQASASPPDLNHDRSLLEIVTNQVIEEYAERIPAPSRHVFDKECRDIRADVDVFYRKELESSTLPRYFELELSIEGGPMEVDLGDGLHIRMKGFVDRIDETAPHQYRIIDYKTGSPRDYRQNETFAGGTQLQHALYAVAAEQWLRQTGLDPQAEVREAAYYFPTQRGRGQEVVRIHNNRQELAVVVRRLLEAMDQGIYVPTQDPQTCAWCDYRIVCGHHAERMKEKRLVPENTALLEPLLEVEQHD